jgi:predicted RNase H-like HicB family nuclease
MYRVGFPGWKLAARFNVPLLFRLDVVHDEGAKVYVATSPDLKGLVVEADTLEALVKEVQGCVDLLMQQALHRQPKQRPMAALGDLRTA